MRCFICDTQATDIPVTQGGRLVNCPGCGWYNISGTAVHLLQQDLKVFNVTRTRNWLSGRREDGVDQPLIDAQNTLWE